MRLIKYIVVVPIIEGTLDLLKLTKRSYVLLPLWDDLRCLHGKCLFGQFKIFVDQQDPFSSSPKLFVCTLVDAQTLEHAYEGAVKKIRTFATDLVTWSLCSRSFEPIFGEMRVAEFYPTKLLPAIEKKLSLDLVELTVEKGNPKTIHTPYYSLNFNYPLVFEFSHNEYVTAYSILPKLEGAQDTQRPDVFLLRKEELQNMEFDLDKIRRARYTDEAELINVIAPIYSAAIMEKNMLMSYLLLWQVLECVASTRDFGTNLLDRNTMNGISALLRQEGYAATAISRLRSILRDVRQKNQIKVMAEILQDYAYPAQGVHELEQKVKKLRKMRGAIVHPKTSATVGELEIMDLHGELRHIIDTVVKKVSRKVCSSVDSLY